MIGSARLRILLAAGGAPHRDRLPWYADIRSPVDGSMGVLKSEGDGSVLQGFVVLGWHVRDRSVNRRVSRFHERCRRQAHPPFGKYETEN